jgi:hypothetical protein
MILESFRIMQPASKKKSRHIGRDLFAFFVRLASALIAPFLESAHIMHHFSHRPPQGNFRAFRAGIDRAVDRRA